MARRRRKTRRNPIASITRPLGVLTQNYTLETAKMGGAMLGGMVGTAMIGDALIKFATSRVVKQDGGILAKIANFLTTGLAAGGTAWIGGKIAPYRKNEMLAGGMLVALTQVIPSSWLGGFQVKPKGFFGWSDDLSLDAMHLGEDLEDYADPREVAGAIPTTMRDFADPREVAGAMRLNGMGEQVWAGPYAPINRPMLSDYSALRQAEGAINIAGMEDVIADEIA